MVQPDLISVSNVAQSVIACHGETATVTITAAGGTAPLSYSFNGSAAQAGNTFTGIAAGVDYPYSVTDKNGCLAATGKFTVVQPDLISVSNVAQSVIACHGETATVTITAAGGTAPLSYSFNGSAAQAGNTFTGIAAGVDYPYSVTDKNGCLAATGKFTVVQPDLISVSNVAQSVIACHGETATVTITAAGGTAPLSYSFNGSAAQAGNTFTGIAAGVDYPYSVTDKNGCLAATGKFTVVQPDLISVSNVAQSVIACHGETATVTITAAGGTAPLSYSFNGSAAQAGNTFTGIAAGVDYPYSVTDKNGCLAATGKFTVVQPDLISVSNVAQSVIACHGETATVTITAAGGTAPLSYSFNGSAAQAGNTFTGIAAGVDYPYSVTDKNGCLAATGKFTVVQPDLISVSNVAQSVIACHGETATVTITAAGGTAPLSYSFNGSAAQAGNTFTGIAAGVDYPYSVTDKNGCLAATGKFTVVQPDLISVSNVAQSVIACHGGTATVTITAAGGTAPLSYSFNGSAAQAGNTFTGIAAGVDYPYSVTDKNGCLAATGKFTVVQPDLISVSNVAQSVIACHGETATVTITAAGGTAPLSYSFNGSAAQAGNTFTGIAAGVDYPYSVTDKNGCLAATGKFTVVQPDLISVSNVAQSVIACHGETATVTITAAGGTAPLSYSFNGSAAQAGNTFTGIAAGVDYPYSVTDKNGCLAATGKFTVVQPDLISVSNVAQSVIACHGETATVTITAAGGTAPLSYSFNGSAAQAGNTFTGIAAGVDYPYSVTDKNGCLAATGKFTVVQPDLISVSNVAQSVIACHGETATVTITAAGGTAPLSYSFNGSAAQAGNTFTGIAAGVDYPYSVTDKNGCLAATGKFTVVQPDLISVSNVAQSVIACHGETATVTITAAGGTAPLSYSFNGSAAQAGNTFTGIAAGVDYPYSVTDKNGCLAATGKFTVVQPDLISVSNVAQSVIACHGETATVTITAAGGTAPLSYSFNGSAAQAGNTFTGIAAGVDYPYSVTDKNGCLAATGKFTVVQPDLISVSNVAQSVIACHGETATVTITAAGGTAPLSYSFNGSAAQAGNTFTGIAAGVDYPYSVTDKNGCLAATGKFTVVQPDLISVSNVAQSVIACHGETATVTITAAGGTAPLSYSFNGSAAQAGNTFTGIAAGVDYPYSVTDKNGCLAATGKFTVVQPDLISVSNVAQSVIACHGETATVTITAAGGTAPLSYSFNGSAAQAGNTFTGIAAGVDYPYSVTDKNGCLAATGKFTVVQPDLISVSNVAQSVIACHGETATVTITAAGGTAPLSYSFNGSAAQAGNTFTGIAAGVDYPYSVTDKNGCLAATGKFTVVQPDLISVSNVAQSVIACHGETATVTITAAGGTAPLSYSFNGSAAQAGNTFTGIAAGVDYPYSVTDKNGCLAATGKFTVVQPDLISVSNVAQSVIACHGETATVTITAAGGTAPLSYSFNGSAAQAGNTFTGIAAGVDYPYSVTDKNGCLAATGKFTVVQPDLISVSNVAQSVIACHGETATVTITAAGGTAPLSYSFNGSAAQAGNTFTGIAAGVDYPYSVTDKNGCLAATGKFTVVQPDLISVSNVAQSVIACHGETATVTITAAGGTAPLSYSFNGSAAQAGNTFTGIAAGVDYPYSVTDKNGCLAATGKFTVVQPDLISVSNVAQSVIACHGETATVTITAAGGTAPLSYSFNGSAAQAGNTFTGIAAGVDYPYSVTDKNGCLAATGKFTVVQPDLISVSNVAQSVIACHGETATVTITAAGGTAPLSYSFNGSAAQAGNTFTGIAAGVDYPYSVTDKNGCLAATGKFTVVQPDLISVSNVAQSVIACHGETATVTITAAGGTAPLSYSFNGSAAQAGNTFTGIAAGVDYPYSVTDKNGCLAATGKFTVVQPDLISVSNVAQSVIACHGETATVTITAAGGTAPLSYSFNGSAAQAGNTFTGIAAGVDYPYSVTDKNGCLAATGKFTVVQPDLISVSNVAQSVIACHGETATVTITAAGGTAPLSYSFNGSAAQAGNTFTGIAAGVDYPYSVTDKNGCLAATGKFTVVQPDLISVSNVAQSVIACHGETATVTITAAGGTAPLSYSFNGSAAQAGNTFTGIAAGVDYPYSVTDKNGCLAATGKFTVVQPDLISVSNVAQSVIACHGETATVTITAAGGTAPLSYSFNGSAAQAGNTFTGIAAGVDYPYSVTDKNGCLAATGKFTVVQPDLISVSNVAQSVIACHGETATVTITAAGGTAPLSYSFNGSAAQAGNTFTGIAAGVDYPYSVTDKNGCLAATGKFTVVQPDLISVSNVAQSVIACHGETATVTITAAGGTAPLSYSFNGSAAQAGNTFTGIAAGVDYPYSVTDKNGCLAATGKFTVVQPDLISVSNVAQSVIACHGETATVTITAAGGTAPLSYSFNGSAAQAGNTFTGIAAGVDYPYSVTDKNGCLAATGKFTVVQPDLISVSNVAQSVIACHGGTATVTITAAGGTAPLSYSFNGSAAQAGNTFTGIAAGVDYPYSVTDKNGCLAATGKFTVVQPDLISVSNVAQSVIACHGETATVTITAAGGTAPLSYSFNGSAAQAGNTFTGIAAGVDYPYSVTDKNGCLAATGKFTVVQPDLISVSNVAQSVIACHGETATVTITAAGGTAPLSYSFNGSAAQAGNTFTGIAAGVDYPYSVTDKNGCLAATGKFTVVQPDLISVSNVAQSVIACHGETATVTITAAGGTAPLSYSFNGSAAQAGNTFTGIAAGVDYPYSVTDKNGCLAATGKFTVVQPDLISVSNVAQSVIACHGETATVTITAAGGTAPLSYSFNGSAAQAGNTFTGIAAGVDYPYSVTDKNGCLAATGKFTVVQPLVLSFSISKSNISCNGSHNGTITVSATGGNGLYQYSKNNGITWQSSNKFTGLSRGTYNVTVKDINGCSVTSQSVTISEPDPVIITGTTTSAKCNGGSDGSIDLTVSGGSGNYSYLWSNGATTQDINGLSAGVYSVVVSESEGCSVSGPLSYTVRSLNNIPLANDDQSQINEDQVLNGNVLTNDDPSCDGGNVWSLVSNPSHGSLIFNANGTFSYTPEPNFNGTDSFSYKVCDIDKDCSTATVTITVLPVNDPPIAGDDINLTLKDKPVNGNVLTNDSDPDGDALIVKTDPIIQPANGKVVINTDGSYVYTPNSGYSGTDSFVYEVCDNATPKMCAQATVTIKIIDLNTTSNAPIAINDVYQGSINLPVNGSVLSNDFDPDGNLNLNSITLVGSAPSVGTLTLNSNGTFTYIPETGFLGQVSFKYQVCDTGSPIQCDVATVTIQILANPTHNSTFAIDDGYFVKENTPISGNVLTNDYDPEGDLQTVNTVPVVSPAHGTLVLGANGVLSYTPESNYIGLDQFVYEVCDNGTPKACDKATVYLVVAPVNYIPVAIADKNTTNEDTSVSGNVSTNDIPSPDGGNNWTIVSQPNDGKVIMNPDGTYTYTPDADFNGTDTFIYKVCDVGGDCGEASVTITVIPVDDSPVANDDQVSFHIDDVLNDSVADNDIPSGDGGNVWSILTQPTHGTIVFNTDGSYTYTPGLNFVGSDSFTYQLCDIDGDCDQATVTIGVEDVVLPNQILTPNGDGKNDTFIINGIEFYPENKLTIYNRWGNKVYQKAGYLNEWEGTSNETKVGSGALPVGTYFYVLEYGNHRHKTGYIYLDR